MPSKARKASLGHRHVGLPQPNPPGVEVAVVGRSKPERKARKNKIFEGADAPAQLVAALRADGVL